MQFSTQGLLWEALQALGAVSTPTALPMARAWVKLCQALFQGRFLRDTLPGSGCPWDKV